MYAYTIKGKLEISPFEVNFIASSLLKLSEIEETVFLSNKNTTNTAILR
jgi:hypothetical protein